MFRTTLLVALAMYASADLDIHFVNLKDVTVAMGVGFYGPTEGIFPAAFSGQIGVFKTEDASTINFEAEPIGLIPLTAAGDKKTGTAMAGGMGAVLVQTNGDWRRAEFPNPLIITQDVKNTEASGIWSVTGLFAGKQQPAIFGGVATSADDGASWQQMNIPEGTFYDNGSVRYASAPSADVMYVNAGMWADDADTKGGLRGASKRHHLNQRMSVDSNGKLTYADIDVEDPPVGYWAQVAKTTDGGISWSIVLDDTTGFYPNDIDCYDEDNCAMAVEGTNEGGEFGAIMITNDGGETWTTSDSTMSASMMGVKMSSTTHVWGAGASPAMVGGYFLTTDGKTWDSSFTDPSDMIALITSVDFDGNDDPWGAGMKRTQISCIIHGERG